MLDDDDDKVGRLLVHVVIVITQKVPVNGLNCQHHTAKEEAEKLPKTYI